MSTPGRNEPCPCGSGKKYKRCCGTGPTPPAAAAPAPLSCPRCGCTPASLCSEGCGPAVLDNLCAQCALQNVARIVDEQDLIKEPAPRGMVWRITARPVGKGLDLEGSHLHIGDLPPALRDIARGFDEPVVIEIAGSGAPWVRVFNTKIVTATSVPRGGDAPS